MFLTCRYDVEDTGYSLATKLVVSPAEQGPVVHLSFGPVTGNAHSPVDYNALWRDRRHLRKNKKQKTFNFPNLRPSQDKLYRPLLPCIVFKML